MKIMDAADMYVKEAKRIRTPTSKTTFFKTIATLDKFVDGADIADITNRQLTDWCYHGNVASATIKKRRAHARSMFAWLTWRGVLDADPASGLEYSVSPGGGDAKVGHWLSEHEAAAVIAACPDTFIGQRDRLIMMLGFYTGLRAFEISQIRWPHFSADFRTLQVVGKGDKPAVVGIPPAVARALAEWRAAAPENPRAVLPVIRVHFDEELVERRKTVDWACPLSYDGIRVAVVKAGKRAGFKLAPHDMRRSFAGILEAQGVAANDISRAMRHANLATTSRYLDRNPNKAVEVTANLTIGGL